MVSLSLLVFTLDLVHAHTHMCKLWIEIEMRFGKIESKGSNDDFTCTWNAHTHINTYNSSEASLFLVVLHVNHISIRKEKEMAESHTYGEMVNNECECVSMN